MRLEDLDWMDAGQLVCLLAGTVGGGLGRAGRPRPRHANWPEAFPFCRMDQIFDACVVDVL